MPDRPPPQSSPGVPGEENGKSRYAGRSAVIIGGGPAGAVAGIILARRGWDVHLIEQHRFPRDKVCGECVSALGIDVLTRLGLAGDMERAGAVCLSRTILYSQDGRSALLPLNTPMWGISRLAMDSLLLGAAQAAGVQLHQPARCEGIEPGLIPTVRIRDLAGNQCETLRPRWVLLADGKGALLPAARRREISALKLIFPGLSGPRDGIELFGVEGHYGGVAPIEDDRWNVAFSVPGSLLEKFGGDLDQLFSSVLRQNTALVERFSEARRIGEWLASPLPRFGVARHWPAGIIPIGNAAAALEPIGGEGMGLAMRSAELAALCLDCSRQGAANVSLLRTQFQKLWNTRRMACRAAARIVATPMLAGVSADFLAGSPYTAGLVMQLMGKS